MSVAPPYLSNSHHKPSPSGRGQGEGNIVTEKPQSERNKLPEQLLKNARALRKNQTDAETLLWQLLRNRQLNNFKFRRQYPIKPYILDFYCHEAKLVIELDGGQHNTQTAISKDNKRTEYLKLQGMKVLRFWNNEVLQNTESVLQEIYSALTPTLSQGEREFKVDGAQALAMLKELLA